MRERQFVADMVKDTYVPKMFRVKQTFPRPKIEPEEIPEIIENLLNQEKFASRVKPGMRIAITAGSRGIANNALTTKCIADFVRSPPAAPWNGGTQADGGCAETCPVLYYLQRPRRSPRNPAGNRRGAAGPQGICRGYAAAFAG